MSKTNKAEKCYLWKNPTDIRKLVEMQKRKESNGRFYRVNNNTRIWVADGDDPEERVKRYKQKLADSIILPRV